MSEETKRAVIGARKKFEDSLTVLGAWQAIAMIMAGLDHGQRQRVSKAMSLMVDGYAQKKEGDPLDREVVHAVSEALHGRPMSVAEVDELEGALDDDDGESSPPAPEVAP